MSSHMHGFTAVHLKLLNSDDTYSIHFRLVRIKLDDGNYECLVTNLPRDRFSMKS